MALINYKDSQGNWQAIDSLTITDPTLTQPGVSADAKAVGDKFNNINSYIIEKGQTKLNWGSTGFFWSWYKFSDGSVIMYGWGKGSLDISTAWGGVYYSVLPNILYPDNIHFISEPCAIMDIHGASATVWNARDAAPTSDGGSLKSIGRPYITRGTKHSPDDITVMGIVYGKEK